MEELVVTKARDYLQYTLKASNWEEKNSNSIWEDEKAVVTAAQQWERPNANGPDAYEWGER